MRTAILYYYTLFYDDRRHTTCDHKKLPWIHHHTATIWATIHGITTQNSPHTYYTLSGFRRARTPRRVSGPLWNLLTMVTLLRRIRTSLDGKRDAGWLASWQ